MKPIPTGGSVFMFHNNNIQQVETVEDQGSTAAMEVDDGDTLDLINDVLPDSKPSDADFFNSFEDDFDDSDIA